MGDTYTISVKTKYSKFKKSVTVEAPSIRAATEKFLEKLESDGDISPAD